jgi:reactive chlorine resistance protein C
MKLMDRTLGIERFERFALRAGPQVTRYGIVFLLLLFGGMKWTAAEAHGIQPLVSHSPFWGWLYGILGVQGTSIFFGVFEITAAIAIATRPWLPFLSAAGSAFCVIMFLTTISFLFTTPGFLASEGAGFVMKDIVLLGGSIWTAGEALATARTGARRSSARGNAQPDYAVSSIANRYEYRRQHAPR